MLRPQRRRLEAFTLLELLIVLVVSALLFSMAYAAVQMVQRQQLVITLKSATLGRLSTWQAVMAADFYASQTVEVKADRIYCQREVPVTYIWQDSMFLREQGELLDTFPGPVRQITYFWQGQPRSAGLIDELSLLAIAAQDSFYVQAQASYAAQSLVPAPLLSVMP